MEQLTKIVTRQDATFKLSPSSSNETSINLSNEISNLISDESGEVSFRIYRDDFIKALSALCLMPKVYMKKDKTPSKLYDILQGLSQQISAQFGDSISTYYTVNILKRDDGRAYFNNLKKPNGFNFRSFLVEQYSEITFRKNYDGSLEMRLSTLLPEESIEREVVDTSISYDINQPLQIIYFGAPGTGKSFTIDDAIDDENSVRITFHPDSDYASFVGAYKPTMEEVPMSKTFTSSKEGTYAEYVQKTETHPGTEKKIVYKYVPQAFLKAYVAAWSNLNRPYFLVIEEINRGNCAQIFGDLFQLLDRNNSGSSSYAIHADEDIAQFLSSDNKGFASLSDEQKEAIRSFVLAKDNGKKVAIGQEILDGKLLLLPPNLYIWATMNTSDQSLFPIDSAFKRRWNWRYMPIDYTSENWTFAIGGNRYSWGEFLSIINPEIYTLTESSDKQMGYYFAKADPETGIISEEVFLNKVLFYLWTDVFKDYDVSSKFFRNEKKNRSFRFTDFFDKEQPAALEDFIANFKLKLVKGDILGEEFVQESDNQESDNSSIRKKHYLLITDKDGNQNKMPLNEGYFNFVKDLINRYGEDKVAETINSFGITRHNGEVLLMDEEPYPNLHEAYRQKQVGRYYILIGVNQTAEIAKRLNDSFDLGYIIEEITE